MKTGALIMQCEACKVVETLPAAASKRAFMTAFNRFVRRHRIHEYRGKVGEGKRRIPTLSEQRKRVLRRMPYGATKQ